MSGYGPGIYDPACTHAREATLAESVVLIIVNGAMGSGFSVQTANVKFVIGLPALLRSMADEIEATREK